MQHADENRGGSPHCVLLHAAGELLLRQLKNSAWTQRQIGICRAESPRNSEPDRATLSIAQGVSPGYGVVIRPEPRQLAGWQIRMSVPFMLSIDYLNINAHPRLPPTRLGLRVSGYACACYALTGRIVCVIMDLRPMLYKMMVRKKCGFFNLLCYPRTRPLTA